METISYPVAPQGLAVETNVQHNAVHESHPDDLPNRLRTGGDPAPPPESDPIRRGRAQGGARSVVPSLRRGRPPALPIASRLRFPGGISSQTRSGGGGPSQGTRALR